MPRISYLPIEQLVDPELRGLLHHAARHGTPRPESQAIRAHVPGILRAFSHAWEDTYRGGVCDHAVKDLCRLFVSKTLSEDDDAELVRFEDSDRFDEREKAALAYTRAIVRNPREADAALWARLREHFTDEELAELGWFVGLTLGQQRWLKTMDLDQRQVPRVASACLHLTPAFAG